MRALKLLIASLFISCSGSNSDMDIQKTNTKNAFKGYWNLAKIRGGFSPTEQFTSGDVVFNFLDNDSVKIMIEVLVENSSKLPFKNDTILSYEYDSIEIVIGDENFEYIITDSLLKLFDNLASDGIMLELVK